MPVVLTVAHIKHELFVKPRHVFPAGISFPLMLKYNQVSTLLNLEQAAHYKLSAFSHRLHSGGRGTHDRTRWPWQETHPKLDHLVHLMLQLGTVQLNEYCLMMSFRDKI